ncbi:MAG: lysophospholipid acyltransferase family protein [Oxalobacteraceae bacterium]|nr:lysophospholipid acyltransferase family protein [Oxalobacteraceae bacterium]
MRTELIPAPRSMPPWMWRQLSRLTGIDRLDRMYRKLPTDLRGAEFALAALRELGVSFELSQSKYERIPSFGPVVVTANHPFGGIDGLAAIAAIATRRPDLKVIATSVLASIPAIRDLVIAVDNFGLRECRAANVTAARQALRHVWNGGALLIFPAGEVASLDLSQGCIADPAWKRSALTLIRAAKAPVMPLYVHGSNGLSFQLAGLLHPALRTALLPREVANKRGSRLDLRFGEAIPAERIKSMEDTTKLEKFLRIRLYALAAPRPGPANDRHRKFNLASAEPIALAQPTCLLEREIGDLPASALLTELGSLQVYSASAAAIPNVLQELGRLRELTFRAVGEGTGVALDLDIYDRRYEHLFAWDSKKKNLVGAYRLAKIDQLRHSHGRQAFYLTTLFEFREPFFVMLGPALELGRSFVRAEYQRSFAPLLALWRGIGEYVGRNPHYSKLIGPVSISADYDRASHALLVRYLKWHHFNPVLASLIKPRVPFRATHTLANLNRELRGVAGLDTLSDLLPESDAKRQVPVLLRQYLKLGGDIIGFNVDPDFGNCLDCLTIVDLRRTPDSVLSKYMADDTLRRFRAASRFSIARTQRQRVAVNEKQTSYS